MRLGFLDSLNKKSGGQHMKNMISTLVIACLFSLQAKADHQLSDLRLRKFDNAPVTVQLNNRYFDHQGPVTKINNLEPGRYRIKIWGIRYNPGHPAQHNRLLYNGFIDVPAGVEVRAMLTRNNLVRINEIVPLFIPAPTYPVYDPIILPNPDPCGSYLPQSILCPEEFNALLSTIDHQSFESTKLMIARQAIRENQFITTNQVSALLNRMDFESSKLELAKFAYQYTIDRHNYFRLYNDFTFDSSVRDLSEFINRYS